MSYKDFSNKTNLVSGQMLNFEAIKALVKKSELDSSWGEKKDRK